MLQDGINVNYSIIYVIMRFLEHLHRYNETINGYKMFIVGYINRIESIKNRYAMRRLLTFFHVNPTQATFHISHNHYNRMKDFQMANKSVCLNGLSCF